MRDPKRIRRIIRLVYGLWRKHPDLRLGQLLEWMANGNTLFYVEDDLIEDRLHQVLMGAE